MSTTLNNILGGGTRQTSPPTTPPPAAPDENMLTISDEEKKGISPAQAVQPAPTQQVEPQQPKRLSYEDMFRQLNPYKPPTQEELEKERKKQRREQIFAAIGDGISALSNLYFTTQYAPNMYSGRNTASQRVKDRWDKLAADRNANMTAYINGLMRARQADDAYDDNERQWARQLGLDKIKQQRDAAADARAEAEEERKKELHPYARRKAEGDAQRAEAQAKYAEEYEQSRIGRNKAAAGASNAAATASYARANGTGSGGAGAESAELKAAYRYWESLTPERKDEWRERNGRKKVVRTGTDTGGRRMAGGRRMVPVYEERYLEDDEDFIRQVWEQRKGYLRSHGRGDEIATGGYNLDFRPGRGKPVAGFGGGNQGKKKIAGFGVKD